MPCTKCGSQDHSRDNCRWPGVLLVVFSILFLFRRARDRCGIVDLHFHDSRATALTRLSERLDVLELARMVGHRDLKSLMVYYRKTASQLAYKLG